MRLLCFTKQWVKSTGGQMDDYLEESKLCPLCGVFVTEPYICCAECENCFLCLSCFAKGKEFGSHQNNHSYEIKRNNFTLFVPGWTAAEELALLDAVLECGIGNWGEVARQVKGKSKEECRLHYFQHYVYNPKPPLPKFSDPVLSTDIHPTPIVYKPSNNPPRPPLDSPMCYDMAGYMAARGDFNIEYDNYAELDIRNIEFNEEKDPLQIELNLAMLNIYRTRMWERARRKHAIRKHGIINPQGTLKMMKRYEATIERNVLEKLVYLSRLLSAFEFDLFLEGLHYQYELQQKISLLQECHEAGIKHQSSIGTYLRLKQRRERQPKKSALANVLAHVKDEATHVQWLQRQVLKETAQGLPDTPVVSSTRRTAPPLNIIGFPGYEKISAKERELCSALRLAPNSFLQFKNVLINEYQRQGQLKLAQARTLIKIDVNKTRKIYDFLLKEGLISKQSS